MLEEVIQQEWFWVEIAPYLNSPSMSWSLCLTSKTIRKHWIVYRDAKLLDQWPFFWRAVLYNRVDLVKLAMASPKFDPLYLLLPIPGARRRSGKGRLLGENEPYAAQWAYKMGFTDLLTVLKSRK